MSCGLNAMVGGLVSTTRAEGDGRAHGSVKGEKGRQPTSEVLKTSNDLQYLVQDK